MELLTIICETAIDQEIHNMLDAVDAPGYTRFSGVTGMGATGRREGSTVWPGRNTVYLIAIDSDKARVFVEKVKQMIRDESARRRIAIKIYSQPVTELI